MSLSRLAPYILGLLALSAVLFTRAAGQGHRGLALLFAMLAPLVLVAASLAISLPHWRREKVAIKSDEAIAQARRTARLFAMAFGWGAASMLGVYSSRLTELSWRHGWQYGCAMALLAGLMFCYAMALGRARGGGLRSARVQRAVMWLTIAGGVSAAIASGWLVASGKLTTTKSDWAANHIFLACTIAFAAMSTIAVLTKLKMVRDL